MENYQEISLIEVEVQVGILADDQYSDLRIHHANKFQTFFILHRSDLNNWYFENDSPY